MWTRPGNELKSFQTCDKISDHHKSQGIRSNNEKKTMWQFKVRELGHPSGGLNDQKVYS